METSLPTPLCEAAAQHSRDLSRTLAVYRATVRETGTVQENCSVHGPFIAKIYEGTRPGRSTDNTDAGIPLSVAVRKLTPCPTCVQIHGDEVERQAKEQAEVERRAQRERRIQDALEGACIPVRYADKRFADFEALTSEQRKVLDVASDFVSRFASNREKGLGLIFAGPPGTGKSLLAMISLQEVIRRGYYGRYTTLHGMIQTIRRTWGKDGEGRETDVLDEFCSCSLLVIDEIGAQLGSESEKAMLFDVIDRRYSEMRSTILATNLDHKALAAFVDPRVWDRLTQTSKWVAFKGESQRPAARKAMEMA